LKGTMENGAREMFNSIKKFKALPAHVQVWPGHGAGSACGKFLGAAPSSTVGYEKLVNWALSIEDEFVKTLLAGQPEPSKYFEMMKKMNKIGPEVLGGLHHPAKLTLNRFQQQLESGISLVDSRNKLAFAGGHIAGSINIQDNSAFSTWSGWILDYEKPFMLIAPEHRIKDLTKALVRIGLDNIAGYIPDMGAWANTGHELETLNQMTVCDLHAQLDNDNTQVIDVKGLSEYDAAHISGAENIQWLY